MWLVSRIYSALRSVANFKVVGGCFLHVLDTPAGKVCEVTGVGCYQRSGAGRRLVGEAKAHGKDVGRSAVVLLASPSAIAFYKHCGFAGITGHGSHVEDALLDLSASAIFKNIYRCSSNWKLADIQNGWLGVRTKWREVGSLHVYSPGVCQCPVLLPNAIWNLCSMPKTWWRRSGAHARSRGLCSGLLLAGWHWLALLVVLAQSQQPRRRFKTPLGISWLQKFIKNNWRWLAKKIGPAQSFVWIDGYLEEEETVNRQIGRFARWVDRYIGTHRQTHGFDR